MQVCHTWRIMCLPVGVRARSTMQALSGGIAGGGGAKTSSCHER
jgi:hypothetical protein